MYVTANTPEIARIVKASGIRGKTRGDINVREFSGPMSMNSYWDGGSKDEYCLVSLETYETWSMPTSHPYFDHKPNGERCGNLELSELPPNVCLVEGGIMLGKPRRITIHLRPENMVKLLPQDNGPELDDKAKSALDCIRSIKGGQYRRDEFLRRGLGQYSVQNPHIVALLDAGLVKANKAGAVSVTTEGRNYGR